MNILRYIIPIAFIVGCNQSEQSAPKPAPDTAPSATPSAVPSSITSSTDPPRYFAPDPDQVHLHYYSAKALPEYALLESRDAVFVMISIDIAEDIVNNKFSNEDILQFIPEFNGDPNMLTLPVNCSNDSPVRWYYGEFKYRLFGKYKERKLKELKRNVIRSNMNLDRHDDPNDLGMTSLDCFMHDSMRQSGTHSYRGAMCTTNNSTKQHGYDICISIKDTIPRTYNVSLATNGSIPVCGIVEWEITASNSLAKPPAK